MKGSLTSTATIRGFFLSFSDLKFANLLYRSDSRFAECNGHKILRKYPVEISGSDITVLTKISEIKVT